MLYFGCTARAGGCLLESEGAEELLAALESLRRHQRFRSGQITELCQAIGQAGGDLDTLTARETETLCLMVDAKSSKEIAAALGINIKTVECHRTNRFRKLKVHSVVELVRYARMMPKQGRNQPCQCGSNKKYKDCCFKAAAVAA